MAESAAPKTIPFTELEKAPGILPNPIGVTNAARPSTSWSRPGQRSRQTPRQRSGQRIVDGQNVSHQTMIAMVEAASPSSSWSRCGTNCSNRIELMRMQI
jgi:hypothetical protein